MMNWVPRGSAARLELQRRSESEYGCVLEWSARKSPRRTRGAAAGMDDVLEVRLQRPSVQDLILIDRREQSFERTLWPGGAYEVAIIVVELLRPFRDMCVAGCEAEFIVGT